MDKNATLTDLNRAQDRLFALLATIPPTDALALATAHAEQARAAAPSFAGDREAAAAAEDARIAARRHSTGGDWLGAVRSSLVRAQLAHAVAPACVLDAAPAALPVCRRQLAAAGDPEEVERERLAEDLAQRAGDDAAVEHDRVVAEDTSYGVPFSHGWACCGAAREDAARNMYQFAMDMPLDALRRRHASTLAERTGGAQ
jgi:hypothetical protein